jgi:RND superfamily putative drug exporter
MSEAAGVSQVVDPYTAKAISKDGRIGYADVIYPKPADEIGRHRPRRARGVGRVGEGSRDAGGVRRRARDHESAASSESLGTMIGLLVLAITLGSLVAAGLPFLTALIGVGIAVGGVTALTGALELTETATTLATMLGLAVGIDHALFILSRHRRNIGDGLEPREAAAQATGTAGTARPERLELPRRLERRVLEMDIEGEHFTRTLGPSPAQA